MTTMAMAELSFLTLFAIFIGIPVAGFLFRTGQLAADKFFKFSGPFVNEEARDLDSTECIGFQIDQTEDEFEISECTRRK